jgi:general secretion pathway protein E
VEDPVELIIPNMIQKSITRPLEDDGAANPFGPFLKTIKRSGMHYVLLGEIRDEVTGEALTDLVYTGTSVYTTTHASSAIGAYDKLAGDTIKVSRDFLSAPGNIKLIVYQALLPQNCPSCAKPVSELATDGRYKRYGQSYIDLIQGLYKIDMGKVRIRNEEGCPKCRHSTIAELNGYSGRTMVAEMFEPSEASLEMVKRADSIGLHRYFSSLRGDPRMTGKTAMQCAIYKMSQGLIDPREIEPRFHSFETERRQRTANTQPKRIARTPEIIDMSLATHAQGTVAEVLQ